MTLNTVSKQAERALPTLFVERFFQFLIVLLLFVALLWEQTHLVYLSLLILIMINGAKLCCMISARGVKVFFEIDRVRVFPGEKISLCGQMQNNSLLPIWLQIEVPLAQGFFLSSGIDLLSGDGGLLWREKAAWKWELTAPKRGCYPVGPFSLITGDPLGFFQQKKEIQPVSWIIVFPRIVALNPLPLSLEEFFGEKRGENPVEDPVYPVATRDYQTGRPARHIHWKASLRHNCLQEKVFDHTSRKKILLAIDARQFQKDEDEESFEAALEVAASLAVQLSTHGSSIGLVSNVATFLEKPSLLPLSRGEEHLQSFLEALAALRMEAEKPLAEILRQSQDLFRGSLCLYFARQSGKEVEESAEILMHYKIPAVFILRDPAAGVLEKTGHRVFQLNDIHRSEASV